jgi:hypothetical protein
MKVLTTTATNANARMNQRKNDMASRVKSWFSLVTAVPVTTSVPSGSTSAIRAVRTSSDTPSDARTEISSKRPGSAISR